MYLCYGALPTVASESDDMMPNGADDHYCLTEVGQRLELQGRTTEIVDLDGRRIDKLLVGRAGQPSVHFDEYHTPCCPNDRLDHSKAPIYMSATA